MAEHLGRVLRLGPGADLTLFNGEGGEWQATIEIVDRGTGERARRQAIGLPTANRRWI